MARLVNNFFCATADGLNVKISVLTDKVADFFQRVEGIAADFGKDCRIGRHAANGKTFVNFFNLVDSGIINQKLHLNHPESLFRIKADVRDDSSEARTCQEV